MSLFRDFIRLLDPNSVFPVAWMSGRISAILIWSGMRTLNMERFYDASYRLFFQATALFGRLTPISVSVTQFVTMYTCHELVTSACKPLMAVMSCMIVAPKGAYVIDTQQFRSKMLQTPA